MALWEELVSLEETSPRLVPTLKALLKSREDLEAICRLTDMEAQKVVNSISRAIDSTHVQMTESLRKRALQVLCKICGSCQLLPTECVLRDELVETGKQIGSGGFADVFEGIHGGVTVAVKRLRVRGGESFTKIYKRFCKEVVIWKKLSHPNTLPLIGVSASGDALCMVSKLMSHGSIMVYLSTRPSANRLQLLANVGEGLSYLHSLDLIHGDLKGANILVDDECTPRIADFGLMSIIRDADTVLDTHSSVGGVGTPRWSAPELLDPPLFGFKSCQPSKRSDCYSFGMTIYEVLTGKPPFHDSILDAVMMRIVRGSRPERPHLSHAIGFTDPVWSIVEECWKENSTFRPDAETVSKRLMDAAAQWTPTPPLTDDPCVTDEWNTFSFLSCYASSESVQTLDCATPRDENIQLYRVNEEDKTVAPPHYESSVAENLHALAERFYGYYQADRNPEHLDWAIKHEKEAALTYLPTHPGRFRCLTCLADYYCERYEISQDLQDIKLSIEKSADVERRTAAGDPIRPDALLILSRGYHVYHYWDPQPDNLEAAIKYSSEAAALYPSNCSPRGEALMVLSMALFDRYQASVTRGDPQPSHSDLDSAILNSAAAIDTFGFGDPRVPPSRMKLSSFLFARYHRQKNIADLRQSIHLTRLALIPLTPEKRPESLIHLGYLLTHLSHDPSTLTEVATCSKEALGFLPPDDHRRYGAINNLVTASHRMYVTLGSAAQLDEAIFYNRQLLQLLPNGLEPRHSQLQLHRNLLEYRWNERRLEADFAEIVDTTREIQTTGLQGYYNHSYPTTQPSTPISNHPPDGPLIPPPSDRSLPQRWNSRPYSSDDSVISIADSDLTSTGSVETGDYHSESESSLIGHALDWSFTEHDLDPRY